LRIALKDEIPQEFQYSDKISSVPSQDLESTMTTTTLSELKEAPTGQAEASNKPTEQQEAIAGGTNTNGQS
jgi:hypothetical protein